MKSEKSYQQIKADTSRDVIIKAKAIAKANRMTFGGWLADLIEREVQLSLNKGSNNAGRN